MGLVKATWRRFSTSRGTTLAAAVAYRALFALAPLLLVGVAVADAIFGDEAAEGLLVTRLEATVGVKVAEAIQEILQSAAGATTAGVVGTAVLIWAGSGLFTELVGALNTIYGTDAARISGWRSGVLQKLTTLGAVIGFGLVLAALVGGATAAAWLPSDVAAEGVAIVVSMALLVGAITVAFRYLTVHRIRWRSALMGAIVTALTFVAAAYGLAIFLGRGGGGGASGIAGSVVAVVLAVYIFSIVGLLGAALTRELDAP
jgi:membrane protein